MDKGMVRGYLSFLVALVMIAGGSVASADEQTQGQAFSKILGTASFEAHHTFVPLGYCEREACARTQPYWSLVIQSGPAKYELNEVFGEGSEKAPEFVVVGKVVVRPGTRLTIEARVEAFGRGFAILSDVQRVDLVMDSMTVDSPFFGWTCHSVDELRPVYVDVEQVSRHGIYDMRISASTGDVDHPIQKVAAFANVRLLMDPTEIAFKGATPQVRAELAIDQRGGRLNDLDSVLRISDDLTKGDPNHSYRTTFKLSCNRTR